MMRPWHAGYRSDTAILDGGAEISSSLLENASTEKSSME